MFGLVVLILVAMIGLPPSRGGPDQAVSRTEADFKPFNRLPVGMSLARARELLVAEGFRLTEEPKEGNGWLTASKALDTEGTYHSVRMQFKARQAVSVVEFAMSS